MASDTLKIRKLNQEQLEILELLFKFRFASKELVAEYFTERSGMDVYRRLAVLCKYELIAKRFEPSYRLQGKPAAYHLLPAGIKKLSEHRDIEITTARVKTAYKDKTVSEDFTSHCMQVLGAFNQLKRTYRDAIRFYTKVDLNIETYDYFPKPLPDAFLSLKEQNQTQRYFLETLDPAMPLFVLRKQVKQYIDYYESGAWDDTGSDFPVILYVCQSDKQEKQVLKTISKALDSEDEPTFATTTYAKLKEMSKEAAIWRSAIDLDETHDLRSIS